MMEPVARVSGEGACPWRGSVVFDAPKAFWNIGIGVLAIVLVPFYTTVSAVILFVVLAYFSLLVGHSAGMHRMMIHRTYLAPRIVERILIYIGVLVGMAGPFGVIAIHDTRDWAQRHPRCHDFFSHARPFWQDLWWQLTSKFIFDYPPKVVIEDHYAHDPVYRFLERSWRYHQILLALILYAFGGMPFVVWGVGVRLVVSVVGHWSITYFCHNPGPGKWRVKGAAVQASNLPYLGMMTYGECWHNNHHAFPESAKIGLEPWQSDPAWQFIKCLKFLGWAKDIRLPRVQSMRDDLEECLSDDKKGGRNASPYNAP